MFKFKLLLETLAKKVKTLIWVMGFIQIRIVKVEMA